MSEFSREGGNERYAACDDIQTISAELAMRELARRSYGEYLAYVNGRTWKRTRFADYLAREVQSFIEADTGNAYDILVIEAPPQHGKSMQITEALPSWCLGRHPDWRVILASYNDDTAERFARRNKEKVTRYGEALFGITIGDVNRATEFELAASGGAIPGRLISRGILAGITGNPANLLLIDDPIKNRQEADSPTKRQQIWNEWLNSLKSRLAAGAKVVVIMTPWHEDDLAARLLATERNIRLIRLPVEAELDDPLGREPGEPLCPELGKGAAWLAQFKDSYLHDPEGGPRAWSALYQCSPRVEGGHLVRREWWKYYDPAKVAVFGTEIISVDAAFKGNDNNDFVAIEVWGKLGNDYYLRYCLNRHMDFPDTLAAIRTVRRLYPRAMAVLIEDKANGSAIISVLQKEMFCIPVTPKGGKEARVNAVAPAIESGHVYLPEGEAWVADFVDQFTAFPAGKHDDMCFAAGTPVATATGNKPIETIRPGELVWTPYGLRRVTWAGQTGEREVVTRLGLTGTPDHPVFSYGKAFISLCTLTERVNTDRLSLKGVVRWKYRKLLCSMASNTGSWVESDDIISVSQTQMKDGDTRKDFMWRSGNFIRGRQFRRAMTFITRTAILLIMSTATWSVYRAANTMRSIMRKVRTQGARLSGSILSARGNWRRSGTEVRKGGSGTKSITRRVWGRSSPGSAYAECAERPLPPGTRKRISVPTTARSSTAIGRIKERLTECARSAGSHLRQLSPTAAMGPRPVLANAGPGIAPSSITRRPGKTRPGQCSEKRALAAAPNLRRPHPTRSPKDQERAADGAVRCCGNGPNAAKQNKVPVYNLTVEKNHLFYAGGFLVHNCDSATQALSYLIWSSGETALPPSQEQEEPLALVGDDFLDSEKCYDVYGGY